MRVRRFAVYAFLTSIVVLALLTPSGARPTAAQAELADPPMLALNRANERALPVARAQVNRTQLPALTPSTIGTTGSPPDAAIRTASSANGENVELVGHIGGATYAVFVQGNYAYIGVGPRLVILDISDPASPTVLGKTPPLPDIVRDVCVSQGHAYVADGDGGLRVVDVSDPTAPIPIGFYRTPGGAQSVVIAGIHAYVAAGRYGLRVVDVSVPSSPTLVGFYHTTGNAMDVAVSGGYIYVAAHSVFAGFQWGIGSGLVVIDVSEPANPMEVGFYDSPGDAVGVALVMDHAYVAEDPMLDGSQFVGGGLRVVDVSNPNDPTEVGFYDCNLPYYQFSGADDVAVAENYAYLAVGSSGLRVVDVSDPTNLTLVGSYNTPGSAYRVMVEGRYAYVADKGRGLRVIDVASNPDSPEETGFYDVPGYVQDVAVVADYAYIATEDEGLWIVDVSDPGDPTEVGFCETTGDSYGVAVSENYAYIADGYGGLQVVDVNNPAVPVEVGSYARSGYAYEVAIVGDYAYVAYGSDSGLQVVDVSQTDAPEETGFYDAPGYCHDVAIVESYAYVTCDSDGGLRVVDISDSETLKETGICDTPGAAEGVTVVENQAYVADGFAGLRLVDVTIPASPREVGFYNTPDFANSVWVTGGTAYVADRDGLRLVDVTDPGDLAEVGFYDTPGYARSVAVADSYAYIADNSGGLFILRYTRAELPSPTLYAISNLDRDGDYIVDWSDVTGVLTYTLQEDDSASFASPTTRYTGIASQYPISDQAAGKWYYRVKVAGASGESGWSNVVFTTVGPDHSGDVFEPDGTCAQATSLTTDGAVQQHTFHDYADEDWAHFTVTSGITYVVQATGSSPGADLVLELYDACGGDLEGSDDNAFGNDARIIFTAPSSGIYYARMLNHDPDIYGPDVSYELSVRAQLPGGVVLIVAGHDDNYHLQDHILYATNFAYRTFRKGRIPKAHIRYLSAVDDDDRTDADDDGISDVYSSSTSANVETAITTWAANLADSKTPFYLYLVDHGGVDAFLTDGSGDIITPDELDGWLDALETAAGTPVTVIYEACHSGSFIDGLEEISENGRVVIASTGQENNAYPAPRRGAYFSDAFFTALGQSQDLWTSYQAGMAAVGATRLWQTPWLDDNGNAVPNEASDGEVARGRGLINFAFTERPPVIDWTLPPTSIQNGEGTVRARVRDDTRIAWVWAVVYPPSFVEPDSSPDGTMPDLDLPKVDLSDSDEDGEYIGVCENFTEDGVYRLVFYAEDGEGNLSEPAVLEVRTRWQVFLPLVTKQ